MIGRRFGSYEITARLGEGGMGEVYRARDTRLQRDVAVKVLPEAINADEARLARFEREARVLATLSHPNIAVVHGLEDAEASDPLRLPVRALVMELVDGETLADRVRRGPIPLTEALTFAAQIADAVAAAHDKGIIHRDLKPANVMITSSGTVKVLDFGIAKTLDETGTRPTAATLTLEAQVVGTPAYMAPEQLRGQALDKRVDVWAFGVVLFEMLTGTHPFAADSTQDTLAAVLTRDPEWDRIPASVQPLLRACLQRNPKDRLRDLGDVRLLIQPDIGAGPAPRSRSRIPAVALAAAALALAAWSVFAWRQRGAEPTDIVRLMAMLPGDVAVTRGAGFTGSIAISPDGGRVVIAGTARDGQRLYVRSLDRLDAEPLPGTERAYGPFFSHDGAWIGFFADGRLKRIRSSGGAAVDIAAAPGFAGGADWGPDDRIVFAYGADSRLHVVATDGGAVDVLPETDGASHPALVPDGRTILFEKPGWIYAIDRTTGTLVRVTEGRAPRYALGHVLFLRGTTMLAAPFNLTDYTLSGPAVPVIEGVAAELPGAASGRHYALSETGTLAYLPAATAHALVLREATGEERALAAPQFLFENPRFSRDGRQLVVATTPRQNDRANLWVYDLQSGSATQLTFDGGRAPLWTPDGVSVVYSHLGEGQGIYRKRADGRGEAERLLPLRAFHWLVGVTQDSRALAYGAMAGETSSIHVVADGAPRELVGPASTWGGRLSRDGKWLAYYLLESGVFNVYVTPFPDAGERWLITEGTDPAWSPDGSEIYYRSGPRLIAARIDMTTGIRVLSRRVVVEPFLPPLYDDYDIHPDGRTLVMVRPANDTQGREVNLVVNWFSELRRLTEQTR